MSLPTKPGSPVLLPPFLARFRLPFVPYAAASDLRNEKDDWDCGTKGAFGIGAERF